MVELRRDSSYEATPEFYILRGEVELTGKDLNLDRQIQSLLCYRYTTRQ